MSALFLQAGVTRVTTLEELLDTAHVLASQPLPEARTAVAIVGNSGGPACWPPTARVARAEVPVLSNATISALRAAVPRAQRRSPTRSTSERR